MNIQEILRDGMIDAVETAKIENEIMADGKISREEAEQLFELKDKATSTCPEFKELFVKAIKNHILEDGEISEEEVSWFKSKVAGDGEIDELESQLAKELGIKL